LDNVPWSNGFSVEARQNARLNGNQGSRKAKNQPLAEIVFFLIYFFPIFFDVIVDRWDILKKSAQSCHGPNPLYTTRVTKPLKNPFLIFHGQGFWPRALTMKML
jgi:hypothetical protein